MNGGAAATIVAGVVVVLAVVGFLVAGEGAGPLTSTHRATTVASIGAILAIAGFLLQLVDSGGYLRDSHRVAILRWAEGPKDSPTIEPEQAEPFFDRFAPPEALARRNELALQRAHVWGPGGDLVALHVRVVFQDGSLAASRGVPVEEIRSWAAETPYARYSMILQVMGLAVVVVGLAWDWRDLLRGVPAQPPPPGGA